MSNDLDNYIARLLKSNAPLERDPIFRIKVLERRERQRYQRRTALIAIALMGLFAISAGGYVLGARLTETASAVLLCISMVALSAIAPMLTQTLLRFGRTGQTSKKL